MAELLRDSVYQTLRQAIIRCDFQPGQALREQALAEQYGVSRSPVREALLRLEQEDLVTVLPRHGYLIKPLGKQYLEDLFGLRMIVAPACAAEAAKADDAALRRLDAFRGGPANDMSTTTLTDYDQGFHRLVAELAQNERLAGIERNLLEEFERVMALAFKVHGETMVPEVVQEHDDVIDAMQAHESQIAHQCMTDHIAKARQRIVAGLKALPGSLSGMPVD
jgi:GntR family transcriptional regulator, rspAB operon transcriptional repressor